jgi:dienelactone hydrolase
VQIADIEYFHDGVRLVGEMAVDDGRVGTRPGVLVSHDAGGLSEHAKRTARRLAELGYVAFALDYYGGGVRLPPEEVGARYIELGNDPLRVRSIATAGLEVLVASEYTDSSKLAAIGYCFGGTVSLELARAGADLRAVVGFHSGLATSRPRDATNITAKVLVCIGAEDPIVPPDQRLAFEEEMRGGGVDWQLHLYGGVGHSFTNPDADGSNPGMKYDQRSDERSWRAMIGLFDEVF